ncbi:hypothetical protein AB0O28_03795 [Microbispora sp. NPDC088329]|uniref:hypothetical protein n=1 Tax=Microbispora sp. NPDC088329 TaxID=3154869 RepID=UPI0034471A01
MTLARTEAGRSAAAAAQHIPNRRQDDNKVTATRNVSSGSLTRRWLVPQHAMFPTDLATRHELFQV